MRAGITTARRLVKRSVRPSFETGAHAPSSGRGLSTTRLLRSPHAIALATRGRGADRVRRARTRLSCFLTILSNHVGYPLGGNTHSQLIGHSADALVCCASLFGGM